MTLRKIRMLITSIAVVVSSLQITRAEHIDLNLSDYDDDLMRDLDKAIKYFEPDITAGNADAAKDDAATLEDGFKYTEDYFRKKGPYEDAVAISIEGLKYTRAAVEAVTNNDFTAAAAAAQAAAKTCRACHDIYKPLNKK